MGQEELAEVGVEAGASDCEDVVVRGGGNDLEALVNPALSRNRNRRFHAASR